MTTATMTIMSMMINDDSDNGGNVVNDDEDDDTHVVIPLKNIITADITSFTFLACTNKPLRRRYRKEV